MIMMRLPDADRARKIPNAEEKNLIQRAFGGCYSTALECTNCRHKSASPEDSPVLQLGPLHVRNRSEVVRLIDKLKEVFRTEAVEWRCEKCGANVGRKRKTISVAPEYLVINIPRHKPFAWETSSKVKNRVSFGENLRLPVGSSTAHYELASVVAHAGNDMTSGISQYSTQYYN
jgi:ubiquitin C-terminal hydrolase